jgi:hypothetical protein
MSENGRFINFNGLDPAVSATITDGRRRQEQRHLSQTKRKQAERDRARNRRMIDLPTDLEDEITRIAAEFDLPVSQVITFLLLRGLSGLDLVDIQERLVSSRSMRFGHNLDLREIR